MSPNPIAKATRLARKAQAWARQELASTYEVYDDEIGPRDFALSALAWSAGLAWGLPTLTALTFACNRLKLDPTRLQPLYKVYTTVQLGTIGVRVRNHASPEIDPARPYLFIQNHINHFDFITCHNASPHYRQGIELERHFKYPLYGPFMKSRGTVPVLQGETNQSASLRERIREQVEMGRSLLGFPEGTRTTDGRVQPFRRGLFYIARDLGLPIVPVSCLGMYEVMRKGSVLIRPGREVRVYMDAPIEAASVADEDMDDLVERTRAIIADRVDRYYEGREQPPV